MAKHYPPNSTLAYGKGIDRGTAELARHTKIRPRNPERLARLEAEQFGEYGDEIAATACIVTGRWPVDRAHVLGTRGAGHGPEGLAPLVREVHTDFDDGLLSDRAFQRRWGRSRADIRGWARTNYAAWLARRNPPESTEDGE